MKTLTPEHFSIWMEAYGEASRENNPRASADLFSREAKYYETPFAGPMIGREAIYDYWRNGAKRLKDKESTYDILAVRENLGIARWQSKFTVIETGKRFDLDCIFLVAFDHDGLCQTFREWWHIQEHKEP